MIDTYSLEMESLVSKVIGDRFDPEKPLPPEPFYSIKIGGQGVGSPGSVVGIYGEPKSRKSTLMATIAAACLSKNGVYENVQTDIEGSVIWFDTEQSDTEVSYFHRNIIDMAGRSEDYDYLFEKYHALKLRPYDDLERFGIIDTILMSDDLYSNVDVVFIDGIADLLYNVNDQETAKKLITAITNWADKLSAVIFVALHTNKGGGDATGILGGFVNKKASYTIKCEPEIPGAPSQIRPYLIRSGNAFIPYLLDNDKQTGRPIIQSKINDLPSRIEIKAQNDQFFS